MRRAASLAEALPESFASVEDAAEFWDSHSAADDWESTEEVILEFGGAGPAVALEPDLAEKLAAASETRGVSLETLVNLWLQEKLQSTQPRPPAAGLAAS